MASIDKTRKYCTECNRNILAERPGTNHILHLLLTLCTCGFYLLIWGAASVKVGGWKCPVCGSPKLVAPRA